MLHSKKCWVVLTQFWVKYGQTQPLGYIQTTQHFLECTGLIRRFYSLLRYVATCTRERQREDRNPL